MGALVPKDVVARIQYFETHGPIWTPVASAIGSSPAEVAALAGLTAAARAALRAQRQARDAARAATTNLHAALASMSRAGADLIKRVRAKAASDGESVYALAAIAAPARPARIAAPGTPANFTATLRPDGSLALAWQCPNPRAARGTVYQVARQVDGAGAFEAIGVVGVRRFVDATVPAGAARVTYQLTATRSTAVGTAARFPVNLGSAAGAVGGGNAPVKRAA